MKARNRRNRRKAKPMLNTDQSAPRGRPLRSAEDVGPTRQTLAKVKANPLAALSQELQEAAISIAAAFHLLCGHAMSRAANLFPASPGKPAEWRGGAMVLILHYQTWMNEAVRRRLHTESVVDLIIEGITFEECNLRHWPRARGVDRARLELETALKLYIRIRVPDLETRLKATGDWPLTSGANRG